LIKHGTITNKRRCNEFKIKAREGAACGASEVRRSDGGVKHNAEIGSLTPLSEFGDEVLYLLLGRNQLLVGRPQANGHIFREDAVEQQEEVQFSS
jgi:hypothetical protein